MRVRLGVDGVLDQFLDDRGRPLDHFAGGDLIREIFRKPADASHLPPARFLNQTNSAALDSTIRPMISQNW